MTWVQLVAAGWEVSACRRAPSVPWPATPQHHPTVQLENLPATWGFMVAAGWEISAMRTRMDSSVLQFATFLLLLFARMARLCATWVLMQIIAGWETTVCQPDPNVQPLQEFNQIPDVSI